MIPMTCRVASRLSLLCVLGIAVAEAAPAEKKPSPAAAAAKAPVAAAVDPKSFVIGPEDVLLIRVWRDAEVSGQVIVRPDGKITLQLLGDVQAAGLTPEALTQVIYDGINSKVKQVDKSEVTVTVQQVNSRKYFIQGEIYRPGAYALLVPTTVLEAIGNAGGFREFANEKKILIIQKNGTQLHFNYKDVIHGRKTEQNVQLQPGDQIIVP